MLFLRTGLPGSGKTLNAIREIERDYGPLPPPGRFRALLIRLGLVAEPKPREVRDVYYYGIPDLDTGKLKARWIEFDTPDRWYELPDGAVIVIDEAQRVFGAQDGRKARPEHVARFETHRHQGFDIHLITQHPSLLMSHVRRLVGKHINMYRAFGGKRLLRHEYEMCIDNPEKRVNFKQAQETKIRLDSKYFGVYKSATVHTHKFRLPNYVYMIPMMLAVIAGLGGYVYWLYIGSNPERPEQVQEAVGTPLVPVDPLPQPQSSPAAVSGPSRAPQQDQAAAMTPEQYLEWMTPRIADLPMSAPRYDKLTEPKSFPRLSCVMSTDPAAVDKAKDRRLITTAIDGKETFCQCYTQQATRYDTSFEFCRAAVQNGYFDDTRPDSLAAQPHAFNRDRPALTSTGGVPAPQLTPAPGGDSSASGLRVTVVGSH